MTAWVKTVRSSACESCDSRHSCNPGAGDSSQEVEAINAANATVGDRIQISISTGAMLKATFLIYLFPTLCMLGGGIAGNWFAPRLNLSASVGAMASALLSFGFALVIIRAGGQRLGRMDAYRPKIIRILGREPIDSLLGKPESGCNTRRGLSMEIKDSTHGGKGFHYQQR